MKRLFAYLLILVMLLALVGCNNTPTPKETTPEQTPTNGTTPEETTPETTTLADTAHDEKVPDVEPRDLTMDDLRTLVETYGKGLTWSHFEVYNCSEASRDGYVVRVYKIDERYSLRMDGESLAVIPKNIRLEDYLEPYKYINVRTQSIDEFVGNCPIGVHKWDNGTWTETPNGREELVYYCPLCQETKKGEPNQFKIEDAIFTYCYANWENAYYTNALNAHKDRISLPLLKFDTLEEVEQFKLLLEGGSLQNFNKVTAAYDEAFFAENTLMLFCIYETSSSYLFGVNSIFCDGNSFCVYVEQLNDPIPVTDDMAFWIATFSVADSMIENCTEFNAVGLPYPRA
jgi:hypothetical protein